MKKFLKFWQDIVQVLVSVQTVLEKPLIWTLFVYSQVVESCHKFLIVFKSAM